MNLMWGAFFFFFAGIYLCLGLYETGTAKTPGVRLFGIFCIIGFVCDIVWGSWQLGLL